MIDWVKSESDCEYQTFVLTPVSQSIFKLSQELKHKFGNSCRIRTHIDYNEEERVLVYEYFKDNLLSFVKNNPDLPIESRKFILRELGLGLRDIHAKHWLHLGMMRCPRPCSPQGCVDQTSSDMKPNNVMLNWSRDENGRFRVERVVLSDLDCALKLKGEKLLNGEWEISCGVARKDR